MPQKTVGYTELEWVCKRCQTRNAGTRKTCVNCGAPMSTDDQFELPDQQTLITDEAQIQAAKKGADIHCPYCGARNPAGSAICTQCGGDLKDAAARQAGQVLGAFQKEPTPDIVCPSCGEKVKAGSERCPNCGGDIARPKEKPAAPPARSKMPAWLIALIAVLVVACISSVVYFFVQGSRTTDLRAEVTDVSWQRIIAIEQLMPVTLEAWEENMPAEAENIQCGDRYRGTSSEPVAKATEVCGTPYTIDQGSGVGKVVQDCQYQVYESYCTYTALAWQEIDQVIAEGRDAQPVWPEFVLNQEQREGDRQEYYLVVLVAEDEIYNYRPNDPAEFERYQPGSEWTIKVNGFGEITSVEP